MKWKESPLSPNEARELPIEGGGRARGAQTRAEALKEEQAMSKIRVVVTVDVKGDWAPEDVMDTLRATSEAVVTPKPKHARRQS